MDWSRVGMGSVGVVCVIVIWWLAALIISDDVILPSPLSTGATLVHYLTRPYPARGETLLGATAASVARILVGFAWGAIAGIVLGAAMAAVRPLRLIIDPLIELGRPLPPLAFIPLLIVWFGIGELPKILLIGVGVIPVMVEHRRRRDDCRDKRARLRHPRGVKLSSDAVDLLWHRADRDRRTNPRRPPAVAAADCRTDGIGARFERRA